MKQYSIPEKRRCQLPGICATYMEKIGYKTNGFYAEIGAFDGLAWTNTECFATAGWKGLLVEPQQHLYNACKENYKRFSNIIVECCGCGKENGTLTLYGKGSLATTDYGTVEKYRLEKWSAGQFPQNVRQITVPIFTLNYLLEKHNFEKLDVLVIDTEGTELDVLQGFSIDKYKPKIAIIECVATHPLLGEKAPEINKIMSSFNYKIVRSDQTNTVYALEE